MADVHLSPAAEEYVRRAVESGRYPDADAVMADALRVHALESDLVDQKLAALKAKVEAGLADANAGRVHGVESLDDFLRLVGGDDG